MLLNTDLRADSQRVICFCTEVNMSDAILVYICRCAHGTVQHIVGDVGTAYLCAYAYSENTGADTA